MSRLQLILNVVVCTATGAPSGSPASTVIMVGEREIVFAEQGFARGGVAVGEPRVFRIS